MNYWGITGELLWNYWGITVKQAELLYARKNSPSRGAGVGQVWGRCGAGVGQVWGSYGAGVGQVWGRCGAGVGQVWGTCRVEGERYYLKLCSEQVHLVL